MSTVELEAGLRRAYGGFYHRTRRWRRLVRHARGRDPRFHLAVALAGADYARCYRKPTCSPEEGYEASAEDVAKLAQASAAPAQQALGVAFGNARSPVPITIKPVEERRKR